MKGVDNVCLLILEVLERHGNKEHRLLQKEIISYIESDYGYTVHRNTVSKHIKWLKDNGYVDGVKKVYRVNKFTDNEIRYLIDGLLYSQHMPLSEARVLVKKLKELNPISLKNYINQVNYVDSINNNDNKNLTNNIEQLNLAIDNNKQVLLTTCSYDEQGNLVQDNKEVKASPFYIVADKGHYYVICVSSSGKNLYQRRIDRIHSVEILEDNRSPIENTNYSKEERFDILNYLKEHVYMFSGNSNYVTIKLKKSGLDDFIDWFGKEYSLKVIDEDYYQLRIKTNTNAAYYWLLQYYEIAEVISPKSLRERIKNAALDISGVYGE